MVAGRAESYALLLALPQSAIIAYSALLISFPYACDVSLPASYRAARPGLLTCREPEHSALPFADFGQWPRGISGSILRGRFRLEPVCPVRVAP